jgi:beta-lactamase regulating signal transducer with metallopeptidase domain
MDTICTNITDYLLNQTWQIVILFAAVAIVCVTIRKKTAHLRYLLWLLIVAKCLVPSLITVSLAILPQQPESLPSVESATIPEFVPAPEPVILSEPKNLSPPAPTPAPQPSIMARLAQVPPKTWFSLIWLGGVSLFLIIILIKAARFNHRLSRQRKPVTAAMQKEIDELLDRFGIHVKSRIWLLDGIGQPFVWGILRGSIYLPANFGQIGSREHRRGILMHEIAHTLRFDAAVNILQTIAQAIFWFHPLVWLANRNIRAEREKCCDETTIARLSAAPKVYSSAIVDTLIAEYQSTQPVPSLAIAGPIKNIEDRIKTIMKPGKKFYNRPTIITTVTILLLAIIAVPTTIALTHRQPEKPEEFLAKDTEKASSKFIKTLPNGVTVELVGVCEYPSQGKQWWRPDGSRLGTRIRTKDYSQYTFEYPGYEMAFKFSGQDFSFRIKDIKGSNQHSGVEVLEPEGINAFRIHIKPKLSKTSMKVGVAAGKWETIATHTGGGTWNVVIKRFFSRKKIIFSPANETDDGVVITVSDDLKWNFINPQRNKATTLFAVYKNGAEHKGKTQTSLFVNDMQQQTFEFSDVLLKDIEEFQFRTRPYEWVALKNISLKPNFKTDVQVEDEPSVLHIPGFSPVRELICLADVPNDRTYIDLGTGKTFFITDDVMEKQDSQAILAWVKEKSVDIAVRIKDDVVYVGSLNSFSKQVPNEKWEAITADELKTNNELAQGELDFGNITKRKKDLPRTYLFKTSDGSLGVFQIADFIDSPKAVKVRYKIVQQETSPKPDVQVEDTRDSRKDSELKDEIQIAREWLSMLKTDKTEISEALSFMSAVVNFDGGLTTGYEGIQKKLIEMRKTFTNPGIKITFTNFEKLDKSKIEQLMTNSKHSRKYNLSQEKIKSMVLFHLHSIFRETGEKNVDGVFLGFDSERKIVSWFD